MVVKVTRASAKLRLWLQAFIAPGGPKTVVCKLIIVREIQTVFDERSTGVCVIPNAIAADPRICQWNREKIDHSQDQLEAPRRNTLFGSYVAEMYVSQNINILTVLCELNGAVPRPVNMLECLGSSEGLAYVRFGLWMVHRRSPHR